ncbi:MAG TPA: type IV pili methyl-accepting chemotaxis transducer N-terminal domain-containing protein, partial [Gammaproteobacteria bacterium]|nr:type IV pili methyl-accepting chemotaxis transducer N-terminal domain-containing protein [Gammaproteobacteria bacterium]
MAKAKGSNKLLFFLIILTIALVAGAVVNFFFFTRYAVQDSEFLNYIGEQAVLSQGLAKNVTLAVGGGQRDAFSELATGKSRFDRTLEYLQVGNPPSLPPATGDVANQIGVVDNTWANVREAVDTIVSNRDNILVAHTAAETVRDLMPQLLAEFDEITKQLAASNAPRATVYHAARQGLFGQRIARDVDTLVSGFGGDVSEAATRLQGDVAYFGRVINALLDGDAQLGIEPVDDPAIRERITQAAIMYRDMNGALQTILSLTPELIEAHNASDVVSNLSSNLLNGVRTVEATYRRVAEDRWFKDTYGYAFGAGALIVIIA